MAPSPKIRLFVPESYKAGGAVSLSPAQSHYLMNVMRLGQDEVVAIFNGEEGEWLAQVMSAHKKSVSLTLKKQLKPQIYSPDVWLAFAPIKSKTELVVEKATELGVAKLLPVYMKHSVVTRVNMEKLTAHAIEAAEQCERMDVPAIDEQKNLGLMLSGWTADRVLYYGDESGGGAPLAEVLASQRQKKCAVLVGPEGGFSAEEHQILKQLSFVKPFGMGPRILRADTAAVAALACVMSHSGDWHNKPHFVSTNG